jgi:hypothetical protein
MSHLRALSAADIVRDFGAFRRGICIHLGHGVALTSRESAVSGGGFGELVPPGRMNANGVRETLP